eukprot:TRINITY_DN7277_c0_g1_i2.p1 TRINITY_DN7277_c0_g1~~TRINITY_DN7277_c0_g1_i2.p1  ORF type:complete len:283 (-),score=84.17 TRINITY_DN7277_c0_g1_i2:120-968(-)
MRRRLFIALLLSLLLVFALTNDESHEESEEADEYDNQEEESGEEEPNMDLLSDNYDEEEEQPQEEESSEQEEGEENEEEPKPTSVMEDWNEHMHDFIPSDMVTFELGGSDEETFVETIDTTPIEVKGAYFVTGSGESSNVDFLIVDPTDAILLLRSDKNEGVFYFNATKKGVHQFRFINKHYFETLKITLTLHVGSLNLEEEHAGGESSPLQNKLTGIKRSLNDFHVETKFSYKRSSGHLSTVQRTHGRLFIYSILESLVIICASLWQMHYIKKLLSNHRII